MNKQLNSAIVSGLMRHGLTQESANDIARRALAGQSEEWDRISARCMGGNIARVYLFVTRFSKLRLRTFVYAPGEVDNSEIIAGMLGQPMKTWHAVDAEPQKPKAHPVSMFDITTEVCAAIQQAK